LDLEIITKEGTQLGAEYVEARYEDLTTTVVEVKDRNVSSLGINRRKGLGIRVLAKGSWGFASTSKVERWKEALEKACKLALAGSRLRREKINLKEVRTVKDHVRSKMKIKPIDISLEEKVKSVLNLEDVIRGLESSVKAVSIRYSDSWGEKVFINSEGTSIKWEVGHVWKYVWVTGKRENVTASVRDEIGSVDNGWELFEKETNETVAARIVKKLRAQFEGVTPKRGEFPIVAGPVVVGVIAHEALGHLAEADLTPNSPFIAMLGKQVAPEYVSMSDYGQIEGGFGNGFYDDEGVPVRKVEIIKNGILKELMVDREKAAKLNIEPNGHARAESYRVPPLIRMRNTVFERGDYEVEELFEGIKFGYYCVDFRGGQAQLNSAFQVGIQECYEIVNGQIGKPVRDMSISGIAIEALKKITAIAKDFGLENGRCGKGQMAFVSSGGPHIRFDSGVIVGGRE